MSDPFGRPAATKRRNICASRFLRADNGAVAVIFALTLPFILAGFALAVEAGFWLMSQRQLQHVADVATYSALVAVVADQSEPQAAAEAAVARVIDASGLGVDAVTYQVTLVTESRVEVTIDRNQQVTLTAIVSRFFGGSGDQAALDSGFQVHARSVGELVLSEDSTPGTGAQLSICVLALSSNDRRALELGGDASIRLTNCTVEVYSSRSDALAVHGSSDITADCVTAQGGIVGIRDIQTNPLVCAAPRQYMTPAPVPPGLVALQTVDHVSQVPINDLRRSETNIQATYHNHPSGVPMRRFNDGLNLGNDVYTFSAGLFIIDGDSFSTSNNTTIIATSGTAFYLINGARLDFHSHTDARFRGMTSGPWQDIVFFDDQGHDSDRTHVIAVSELNGVLFLPRATIDLGGSTSIDSGCAMVVANTIVMSGNSRIISDCSDRGFFGGTGSSEGDGGSGGTGGVHVTGLRIVE